MQLHIVRAAEAVPTPGRCGDNLLLLVANGRTVVTGLSSVLLARLVQAVAHRSVAEENIEKPLVAPIVGFVSLGKLFQLVICDLVWRQEHELVKK